ncbi:MAG: DUF2341 domain-containing protein, partial [Methanomassiliicoccales archaeon]
MNKVKNTTIKKGVAIYIFLTLLFSNILLLSLHQQAPLTDQIDEEDEGKEEMPPDLTEKEMPLEHGTRAEYTTGHIHPNGVANSDGEILDYLQLIEDANGDTFYEQSGDTNDPAVDWIEVYFPGAGIPASAIVNFITFYYGYYTNDGWQLTTDTLSNITWRVDATENDLGDYSLSIPPDIDIDVILVQNTNLPNVVNLNSGNYRVRFRGHDDGASADRFYLDYCYFTVNYTYIYHDLRINEIMSDPVGGGPFDDDWAYRRKITIDHTKVVEDLEDFPVLIDITDSDLLSKAQSDGDDIFFTASDGETKLAHEIERYTSGTGELIAWVKVPLVSSTQDTVIYMYYNNPNATNQQNSAEVWSNNYRFIGHLGETTGDTFDSTSYGISATPDASISRGETGQIGNAYLFDGIDAEVDFGPIPDGHLDFGYNSCTFSAWVNINQTADYQDLVAKGGRSSSEGGYVLVYRPDGQMSYAAIADGSSRIQNEAYWINYTWVYLVGVCDRTNGILRVYMNGVNHMEDDNIFIPGSFGGIDGSANDFEIGDNSDTPEGWIDEVRVSSGARSGGWIKTEYNNQFSPSTFYTVGVEEQTSSLSSSGYEWVEIYNAESSSVDLNGWYLKDHGGNIFDISGAGNIPAGGYLVCHLNQQGTNSTTDVYVTLLDEIAIQPGISDGKDNYLLSNGATLNFGTATIVSVRNDAAAEHRPIIEFDVSSVPDNIEDAKLWLYRSSGNAFSSNISLYRLTQSWTESGSNWNTYDGATPWASVGGDYDVVEESTTFVPPTNGWYSWSVTDLIKGWVKGTYSNYGMLLGAEYDANAPNPYFRSSDYTDDTDLRPKLVINLTSNMLDYTDGLTLAHDTGVIIDYVAWGGDPRSGDDDAVSAGYWTAGDYIDTSSISEAESFGLDKDSTDTNSSSDWEGPETDKADPFGIHAGSWTQGSRNLDQSVIINEVLYDPTGSPYDGAWNYKKKITLHAGKVAGDLYDFPVVLDMTLYDLATFAQPDGDDILFVGADGDTKLAHEIEMFDSTAGRLVVWIKIPFLSSTDDTVIYMYYGNTSASNQQDPHEVWTNGFVGVYHLKEDAEPYINSVSTSNYGTQYNTPTRTKGKIGYGQEFTGLVGGSGADDMISLGDFGLCDGINENITFSAWAYTIDSRCEDGGRIISKRNAADNDYIYSIGLDWSGANRQIFQEINTDSTGYQVLAKDVWVHVAGTFNGTTKIFYINGSEATEDYDSAGALSSSPMSVTIGANDGPSVNFGGIIDEVRISNLERSEEWIATERNIQLDPTAFFSIGDCNNRKPITINSSLVSGDLTDFPVFINITDSDLSANARGDGYDIHFKNPDGTSLHHEMVSYNGITGELKAWVRIPSLSSTVDTMIYMYYNNPLAGDHSNPKCVYDDDFRGVWHLNELPREGFDNQIIDSSYYMNHLESVGSMDYTNQVSGRIDGTLIFDGSNDYLYRDDYCSESLDMDYSDFTIEAWVQSGSLPPASYPTIVEKGGTGSGTAGYWFFVYDSNDDYRMYFGDGDGSSRVYADSKADIKDDQWHHLVVSVDRDGPAIFYLDGKLDNLKAASPKEGKDLSNPTRNFLISDSADTWDGLIDEVRISKTVRSYDWINTSYMNIENSIDFCSVGTEELIEPWFDTDWGYRKNIIINSSKVSGGVADFPVLVKITDSDLSSDARSDGYDIIFVQGQVRLDHEIENYNSGTGELLAWVKVPWLSPTTDKVIQMYYGNSGQSIPTEHSYGVWSNNYVGVYHMLEESGSIENSVSLSNYGTRGDSPIRTSGRIGYGQEFTGSTGDDRFILGDFGITDGQHSELTLSFWVNIDDPALDSWGRVIVKRDETDTDTLLGAYLSDDISDKTMFFRTAGDSG